METTKTNLQQDAQPNDFSYNAVAPFWTVRKLFSGHCFEMFRLRPKKLQLFSVPFMPPCCVFPTCTPIVLLSNTPQVTWVTVPQRTAPRCTNVHVFILTFIRPGRPRRLQSTQLNARSPSSSKHQTCTELSWTFKCNIFLKFYFIIVLVLFIYSWHVLSFYVEHKPLKLCINFICLRKRRKT